MSHVMKLYALHRDDRHLSDLVQIIRVPLGNSYFSSNAIARLRGKYNGGVVRDVALLAERVALARRRVRQRW